MYISMFLLLISNTINAANPLPIPDKLKINIQNAMKEYISEQTFDEKLYVFDAIQNKLLKLKFKKLHPGVVKDGDFYLSCADFVDQNGKKVDLDFMVKSTGDMHITTQSIVHAVEGKYRPYHVGDRNE